MRGFTARNVSRESHTYELGEAELGLEEVEVLKRAMESSYDRERAIADRLRQAEEDAVEMRQQISALRDEIGGLHARLDSLHTRPLRPVNVSRGQKGDALSLYQNALAIYKQKQSKQAVAQFDRVLAAAPYGASRGPQGSSCLSSWVVAV